MPDLINFTLPELNGEVTDKEMKQIKNYLFQLTEQMKFYLNNIDTDNFTDDYKKQLQQMISDETANMDMSKVNSLINRYKKFFEDEINASAELITGNKGGYIVINDSDGDSFPDEILILDTSDVDTAQKIWRWNKNGLMFQNKETGSSAEIALTMEGKINANMITVGVLRGIRIEVAEGTIGGWNITEDGLSTTWKSPVVDGSGDIEFTLSFNCADNPNDNVIELKRNDADEFPFRVTRAGTVDVGDLGVRNLNVAEDLTVVGNANFQTVHNVLWSGALLMDASDRINLPKTLNECANGITLVFSAYSTSSGIRDYDFYSFDVKKHLPIINKEGGGIPFIMVSGLFNSFCRKYLYIRDSYILGHDDNIASGTKNGISYNNKNFALRAILEC